MRGQPREIQIELGRMHEVVKYCTLQATAAFTDILDVINDRLKDMPKFIESTPALVDPALLSLAINHSHDECCLAGSQHQLLDCISAHMSKWFNDRNGSEELHSQTAGWISILAQRAETLHANMLAMGGTL
jgi:hypothetical protein